MSERRTNNGQPADKLRIQGRPRPAARPQSIQSVAATYRLQPRRLLRAVDDELQRHGRPDRGPFEIDLPDAGVTASRSRGSSKATYKVRDPDRLRRWFLSGEPMHLDDSDINDLHVLLLSLWERIPEGKSRRSVGRHLQHWMSEITPRLR